MYPYAVLVQIRTRSTRNHLGAVPEAWKPRLRAAPAKQEGARIGKGSRSTSTAIVAQRRRRGGPCRSHREIERAWYQGLIDINPAAHGVSCRDNRPRAPSPNPPCPRDAHAT